MQRTTITTTPRRQCTNETRKPSLEVAPTTYSNILVDHGNGDGVLELEKFRMAVTYSFQFRSAF